MKARVDANERERNQKQKRKPEFGKSPTCRPRVSPNEAIAESTVALGSSLKNQKSTVIPEKLAKQSIVFCRPLKLRILRRTERYVMLFSANIICIYDTGISPIKLELENQKTNQFHEEVFHEICFNVAFSPVFFNVYS